MKPTLLITRPAPDAVTFANDVTDALGEPVVQVFSPAFEVTSLSVTLPVSPDHVIFTSANGVAQSNRLGIANLPAWCVGDKTAEAASLAGFDAVSAGGSAADLIDLLLQRRPLGQIIHIAGRHTRGDVAQTLRNAGLNCAKVSAYTQTALPPTQQMRSLAGGTNPVVAPVFSPRSSHILGQIDWLGPLHVVAISRAVADELVDLGCDTVTTAIRPTQPAMVSATAAVLRDIMDR